MMALRRLAARVCGISPRGLATKVYFEGRQPVFNKDVNHKFLLGVAACGGLYYVTHLEKTPITGKRPPFLG